jgi:hypothetical protein
MIPGDVLAALILLSGQVRCPCCGPVALGVHDDGETPVILHNRLDCELHRDPASPAAVQLSLDVIDQVSGRADLAEYGEPEPRHYLAAS